MGLEIKSYCRIKNQTLVVNGEEISIAKQETSGLFLAEAYKYFGLNYPKFHKMDGLCKLGFIATEAAIQGTTFLQNHSPENIGIIFSNRASSLDTDRLHQNSIIDDKHYLPSPSTFVYTLPNIVIGEISIKYKITGENAFFVTENFDEKLLFNQNKILLEQKQASAVISGWVDYDNGGMDAFIFLTEKADDSIKNTNFKPLNELMLKQLYQ